MPLPSSKANNIDEVHIILEIVKHFEDQELAPPSTTKYETLPKELMHMWRRQKSHVSRHLPMSVSIIIIVKAVSPEIDDMFTF